MNSGEVRALRLRAEATRGGSACGYARRCISSCHGCRLGRQSRQRESAPLSPSRENLLHDDRGAVIFLPQPIWRFEILQKQDLATNPKCEFHAARFFHLARLTMISPSPGPLLIVDDREDIRRSMYRYFSLYFDPVLLAANPQEAEILLRTEQPRFLLCDFWLGADYLPATEYIPRWRRLAPSLRSVALMTGTNLAMLGDVTSVDTLFQKPLAPDRVVEFFLGEVTPEEAAGSGTDRDRDSQ